ncbi:YfaZ family outer membrane protein [Hydrocarboniphaga sp.]|uniref:YfaZ family outer membrane protein n=1 Tax=Hydrocarboniphaga sp. TaxID=2033016 RepID=UPI003D0D7973
MTKLHGWLAAVLLTAAALPAKAETLDLNINDDAVFGQFSGPLSHVFNNADGEYQLGGLYSDDKNLSLTNLHAGFMLSGDAGAQEAKLTAGIGLRGQYTDTKVDTGGGAAIGGQFDVRFAGFDRLGFQGYVWYQPKVLGLGDIDSQLDWALTADYQILRNAAVYLGYRKVRIDSSKNHGNYTADDGAIFGLRLTF